MSHIDNALKKAQREKDSLHNGYNHIPPASTGRKHADRRIVWSIAAGGVLLSVVVTVLLLFGNTLPDGKETVPHRADVVAKEKPSFQTENKIDKSATAKLFPSVDKGETPSPALAVNAKPLKNETAMTPGIDTLYRQALDYQKESDFDKAITVYKDILDRDPEHIFTLNNLGVIYMGRGKNKIAEILFKKAIDLKGDYVDPYYNLACLYAKEGNNIRSIDYLKKAAQINNDVKKWIKNDRDLDNVRKSDDFRKVFE